MSESIDTIRNQLWEKMRDKPYRDTFVAAHLSTNIAAQIQTIREQHGWTKKQLAQKAGMSPSRITVMEDPSYENFTLTTLKRLASAFDVALIARFTPFSALVDWVAELSPAKLQTPEFEKDALSHRSKLPANELQVGLEASTIPSTAAEHKQGLLVTYDSPFSGLSIQPRPLRELSNIGREEQGASTL